MPSLIDVGASTSKSVPSLIHPELDYVTDEPNSDYKLVKPGFLVNSNRNMSLIPCLQFEYDRN